jgi:hypothetical protein
MNSRRIAIVLSILFSAFAGYYLGLRLTLLREALRGVADEQRFATTAISSVIALDRLENGDVNEAKRLLAINVASYYHSNIKYDPIAVQPKLRETIEKTSERSPVLKEMLAKPSQ